MSELARRPLISAAGFAALATLAGCAPSDSPEANPTPGGSLDMPLQSAPSTGSRTLLAYFSRPGENYWEGGRRDLEIGNTKRLAQMIADRIDCDTFEIQAADPYPRAYDPTVQRNVEEQKRDARPGIARTLPDMSGYDTVLLGSPTWNVRAPMIMSTFIQSVKLTGKTVLPFVTYAVSGMGGVDRRYRKQLPGSTVRNGLAVRGEDVDNVSTKLDAWLRINGVM